MTTLGSDSGSDASSDRAAVGPTLVDRLVELQSLDTEIDQLTIRRERLPERDEVATTSARLRSWNAERTSMIERLAELDREIEDAEKRGAELTRTRQRLEAQLKTVIAPREAEALMHEIETINGQRDELDDVELAALEEQSDLDDRLTAHLADEETLRTASRLADGVLEEATADIDRHLADLAARRDEVTDDLDPDVLARYSKVRASSGVAVSQLVGRQCNGCHLDLSAAEIDIAKDEAAEAGYTDCPQCGRMLVI